MDAVEAVWLQPVVVPPSAGKELEAGPEPESARALVIVNDPAVEPL